MSDTRDLPLYLWRGWRVEPDGQLTSIFIHHPDKSEEERDAWDMGDRIRWDVDITHAICLPRFRTSAPYETLDRTDPKCATPPGKLCGCGLNTYLTVDDLASGGHPINNNYAYGAVEYGGRVWQHESGARVQQARPLVVVTMVDKLAPRVEARHGCMTISAQELYNKVSEERKMRHPYNAEKQLSWWSQLAVLLETKIERILGY